jgi:hypothetical protein
MGKAAGTPTSGGLTECREKGKLTKPIRIVNSF